MTDHIETARESEAKRESAWEKDRKDVSPNANKPTRLVDQTGVTTGTRDDQHEMSDDFGADTSRPETPLNPASLAAEDQTERSHSQGDTQPGMGAEVERKTVSDKLAERHKISRPGMDRTAERKAHVAGKRKEHGKVFSK